KLQYAVWNLAGDITMDLDGTTAKVDMKGLSNATERGNPDIVHLNSVLTGHPDLGRISKAAMGMETSPPKLVKARLKLPFDAKGAALTPSPPLPGHWTVQNPNTTR